MSFHVQMVTATALAGVLAGPMTASPPANLGVSPATLRIGPAQPVSFPDLRLGGGQPSEAFASGLEGADLQPPCRNYADEPSTQTDPGFAACWNEKKTAWDLTKPSAIGLSQPQMNSPLSSGSIKSGAPRETPVP